MQNLLQSELTNKTRFYQIQVETTPGQDLFEVTTEYNSERKIFDIQKRYLSRISRYGDAPACVAEKRPDLREICCCSNLLVTKKCYKKYVKKRTSFNFFFCYDVHISCIFILS